MVSINIQRGRDHGIPGYAAVREKCGLSKLASFDQKPQDIEEESWALLRSQYKTVADVDLFVGGLAETPVPGAVVGPTFSCILGVQFTMLMDGDRNHGAAAAYGASDRLIRVLGISIATPRAPASTPLTRTA